MNPSCTAEHDKFRQSCRSWLDKDVLPHAAAWEASGLPSTLFKDACQHGFIGFEIPEQFGGSGVHDFRYNAILAQEACALGLTSVSSALTTHNDIVTPYLLSYANDEQKARWLPGVAAGSTVLAIAMTEPGAGSDLAAISTTAVREGDDYVVNGSKTFITNGINADLVITAVRTASSRHGGLSLIVLERGMPGFERGRRFAKIGMHAQDTCELFFSDVRVPAANLIGSEGQGFQYLVANLAQERLGIAVYAAALAKASLGWTLDYVRQRRAFDQPIGSFQANKHRLAELATETDVMQAFLDQCLREHLEGTLNPVAAAKAKLWSTERLGVVVDACVQLHGGYGYMTEQPIARAYADARVSRIYGGTSEVMKEIIGKDLGLATANAKGRS